MKLFAQTRLTSSIKMKQFARSKIKIGILLLLLVVSNRINAQLLPGTYNPVINSNVNPVSAAGLRYFTNASLTKGSGNIVVSTSPGGVWENIAVSSTSVTITPIASPAGFYVDIKFRRPVPDGVQVSISIPSSAFNTSAVGGFGGINAWQFNTNPSGPILYSRTPAIGAQLTASPSNIVLDFHENIFKGSGSILLKNRNSGNIIQSINVTSSDVTILTGSGSPRTAVINLPTALPEGSDIILEMPAGVFKDGGNVNSIAVNDTQSWFRVVDSTPPTLLSVTPAHQSTINITDRQITLTFSEPVFRYPGSIFFFNRSTGAVIYQATASSPDVVQTGNTLTITRPSNWPLGITIAVRIGSNYLSDLAANFWPGFSTNNDYYFTTCSPVTPGISIALTAGSSPACAGQTHTFTATPTNGGTSPSYQWKVNGVNVGTNSPTFTTSTLSGGVNGITCVLTSNAACVSTPTATSGNIFVSIQNPLTPSVSITSIPANTTICAGNSTTFYANPVNAGASPTYQWKVNGANVGTNQNSFTTTSLTNGQVVTCVITRDDNGCVTSTTATSNTITMTVGSLPAQPSDIVGNTTVCQGSSNAYSVTNVSGTTYTWDTGNAGTITGSGNTVNITWNSSGAKTLTVYASNSCGTAIARTLAVTVDATPAQPSGIVGSTAPGQNQSTQYSVTNESGITYAWNAGSGGTVTGSGNAVSILWTTAGAKTITVTPSSSCGSGTARTLSVTVGAACTIPAQPSIITGSATACTESSGTYSVTEVGGVSYTWNAGVDGNVSGSGNSVNLIWTSIGTKTVTVTPFTDCGTGTPRTLTVVVSSLPAQPSAITGNTTACINSSNTYSVTNVSGVSYMWDTGGKGTITGSGNSISVQWTAAGANTLTVIPSNGCGAGLAQSLSVIVNTLPAGTSAIAGSNLMCTGASSTYDVTNVSGVTYTWSAGAGGAVSGSGNSVSISWSTGGEKVVQVTPSNSCGSGSPTTFSVSVTQAVTQPSTITGITSVDAGATTTYSVTNVPGVSYAWSTSADGAIVANGNSAQVTWTTGGSKTLTVTPSNLCGNGTTRNLTVTVATPCVIPTTPVMIILSGTANTQVGQTIRFQVSSSIGATSYDLAVTPSTGVTLTPIAGGITWDVTFTTPGAYSISGKGVSACGTSGPVLLNVNVCGLTIDPPASVTGATENICPGSTTRYTVNSPLEGFFYDWSLGGVPGVTIEYLNAQRSIADITWDTDWGGVNVTVRSRNACNNTSALGTTLSVSLIAKPLGRTISPTPVGNTCVGSGSIIYTINVPEVGVDYNWILNGAGTVAGNKLSATIPLDGQSRIIKVLGTNSCFANEEVNSISFSGGTPVPTQPSPIVGPSTIDFNVDGTFTVEAQPVGVNFSWDAGPDATITNTASQTSKLIRWSTGGTKTISLNTSNGCGISTIRSYSLYVNGPCTAPEIPDPITGGTSGCANVEYIFSVPFQPNTTFNWSAGADATITGTGTTRSIKWSTPGAKNITVSATNGCTTSASQTKPFTVIPTPAQPAGLTGGNLACSGSTEEFAVNPVTGGVMYAWEIQGGTFTTSGSQNEIVSITWSSAGSNIIKVKASNACGFGPERSITRDISTTPLQPSIITGEADVCIGIAKPYSITNVPGTTYMWNGGAGATVTGSGNAVTISWSSAGAKTITVTPTNSCGSGTARTYSVNVIGVPAQPAAITGNALPVLGSAVAYTVTNVAGVNYAWSLTDKGLLTNSGNTSSVSWNSLGSATLSVTASNLCGVSAERTLAITVNKIPQAITFTLASPILANEEITLEGVSNAGLPVSYTSSNTSIAAVEGNNLVINSSGTIMITASQSGDATYAAATNVVRSLIIDKASQVITFAALSEVSFGDPAFNVGATANSLLPISFTSSNTSVATVDNDGTISILGVGSTNITASQGGDAKYNSATSVVRDLTVTKADQTITFEPLAIKNISDPPLFLEGIASSGLALTYSSSNTSVATVSDNIVFIVGEGTTNITASQPGNENYNAASNVVQELVVNGKQNQSIEFNSLTTKTFGDEAFDLTASASSGLTISYTSSNTAVATVSGSTITIVGAGSTTITASQSGNEIFNPATSIPQVLTVNKADQIINFAAIPEQLLSTGTLVLSATSSAGLDISYSSSNTSVTTVTGATLTFHSAGVTTITASQAGNSNFNAAIAIDQSLTITTKQSQTINFASLSSKAFGDAAFDLSASASSDLPVQFVSSNISVATIDGNVVSIVGAGTTTITAKQAGNESFEAAPDVSHDLVVAKANQTITFSTPASVNFTTNTLSLEATSSAALAVSFASSNASLGTIDGNMLTFIAAGTLEITASQPGNANYNAASNVIASITIVDDRQTISLTGALDFGNVLLGETKVKTITIANTGNAALQISAITLPEGFTSSIEATTVNANASITAEITFMPIELKDYEGSVVISSNAASGNNALTLSGTGVTITGFNEPGQASGDLDVYPNPGTGVYIVKSKMTRNKSIAVMDMSGRAQYRILKSLDEEYHELDLLDLPKGIYYLKIEEKGSVAVKRIVKLN
ncbi:hypothetical protein SanaruYs_10180 [Chryseotalea sanaruensis]|uniref:Ig-like domain-containing protein n=1 Tax=Chryseotalea sanaruensis TaxID=2482724 RepID=A0A401U7D5_9BACT|nr:T9SS type A sorting domain-containing protein [Chryseotalea sanaruensis]GCC50800.1 hypothetical protein SanaruYs_10180 [Chryseotalea sanaruensis]